MQLSSAHFAWHFNGQKNEVFVWHPGVSVTGANHQPLDHRDEDSLPYGEFILAEFVVLDTQQPYVKRRAAVMLRCCAAINHADRNKKTTQETRDLIKGQHSVLIHEWMQQVTAGRCKSPYLIYRLKLYKHWYIFISQGGGEVYRWAVWNLAARSKDTIHSKQMINCKYLSSESYRNIWNLHIKKAIKSQM